MNKENKTSDKQQNGNDFIADVSKSFAVGKVLEITNCIYGHQFYTGELVRIIRHDSSSAAKWLCTNTRSEYWLSEREANVC
jgi:hypothetical protein